MKTKILITAVITFFLSACSKDDFTSKPQLSFKSISSTTLVQGQVLTFNINFTDKEGDIQDTLWVQKISKTCPAESGVNKMSYYKVPNFTGVKDLKGYFDISFINNTVNSNYPSIIGCKNINDSSYFRFVLKDKANNISDTLVSPIIVLLK